MEINNKKIASFLVVSAALIIPTYGEILNEQPYLMLHEEKGVSLDQIENDANCYILLQGNWFIVSFANELYDTNSYYFVNYDSYKEEVNCFEGIDTDKPLYMILDCSILITDEVRKIMEENPGSMYNTVYSDVMIDERDVLSHYESLSCVDKLELVGEDNVFERPIKIYKVNLKK